jgi:hypothetical protein
MIKKCKFVCSLFKEKIFFLIFIFTLFSCTNENNTIEQFPKSIKNNEVSKEKAVVIANNFLARYYTYQQNTSFSRITDINKTVMEVLTFKTITNDNAYFTINYNEGGFVVVAADDRASPILAFSEDGKFSENIEEIPDPVVSWMEAEKESIQFLKESNLTQTLPIRLEWDYLLTITGNPFLCENLIIQKGPLLQTKWGQGFGYNNVIPISCPSSSGGRPPTGCVATAMAQVMKFHQKPTNLNWSQMPNTGGSFDTQALMYNAGIAVQMNYTCNGSGADSGKIPGALMNTFGYSNVTYTINAYSSNTVFQNISQNKPVILTGGRKRNGITWPWNYYTDGHAWVADGSLFIILKSPDSNGVCQEYGFRFLHMNWGWGENPFFNYNGWYNENNFNPGASTYNYRRGMCLINP